MKTTTLGVLISKTLGRKSYGLSICTLPPKMTKLGSTNRLTKR